jgi:hypothetical protein
MIQEPKRQKLRSTYWPKIPRSQMYMIAFADSEVIYMGTSYLVARLIFACMSPRV